MIREPIIEHDGDIIMGEYIYDGPNSVLSYPFKLLNPTTNENANRTAYLEINSNHTLQQVSDDIWPRLQRYFNIGPNFVVIEMNCGEDEELSIFPGRTRNQNDTINDLYAHDLYAHDLYAYVASRRLSQGGTVRSYPMYETIGIVLPQQPAFYVKMIDTLTGTGTGTNTGTNTGTDSEVITYYENIRSPSGNYYPDNYITQRIHPEPEDTTEDNNTIDGTEMTWGNYDTQPQPDYDEEVDDDGTKDEDDNIRGNLGGISGEVLEDCHGHRLFYFIRKESAIRIQRNWRIYLDETREKKECVVCYEKFKFMVKNYNCLHTMCSGCYKQWQTRPGGNKCPTCRTTHLEDCLTRDM